MASLAFIFRMLSMYLIVEQYFCTDDVTSFKGMELELVRMEQTAGTHLLDLSGIRVKKYNRTVAVVDGEGSAPQDIGNSYEFRVSFAYSRLGNNQFNDYPMKAPQRKVCEMLNTTYREYQHIWANYSNMPMVVGEQGLCPFPRGNYWVRNFAPDASWVPPVVPEGYWKMTFEILDEEGTVQFQAFAFARCTKKLL